jgi:hypothetical protein
MNANVTHGNAANLAKRRGLVNDIAVTTEGEVLERIEVLCGSVSGIALLLGSAACRRPSGFARKILS